MNATYSTRGCRVIITWADGTSRTVARCASPEAALIASKVIVRARHLNDVQCKYTASARKFAEAEALPGFQWIEEGITP